MINDVSDTAYWIAAYRASESERPDALFRDPLARRLSGEHGREIAKSMPSSRMTAWGVVMRTVIIDDLIHNAVAGGVDVVLNLGAGLDTRPYRMDLPVSLRWIEVDFPHIIDFKESELAGEAPHCDLQRVKLDLSDRERRRAFLDTVNLSAKNILVLTEGVIPYLRVEDVGSLGDDLRATTNVVNWIVDYFARDIVRMRVQSRMRKRLKNAPVIFDPDDWYGFFASHGWRPKEVKYLAEEALRLKRMMSVPWYFRLLFRLRFGMASEDKRRAMLRFAGYALLERV